MTIEQMTPEEEVKLRLAAGISPSTPTEYILRHIPLWVKMSILRRNLGGGGTTESVTTYDFTTNTYRKNGSTVSLGDISEFIRLTSATEWQGGQLIEVVNNVPRISSAGLLIEKSATELIPNNSAITSIDTAWTATQKTDAQLGDVFEFVSDGSVNVVTTNLPTYPNGNVTATSGGYYRSIFVKKSLAESYIRLGTTRANLIIIVDIKNGILEYSGTGVLAYKITELSGFFKIEVTSESSFPTAASENQSRFFLSNSRGRRSNLGVPTLGHSATVALPTFMDTLDFPQSIIKTSGTQATRSPDILNIPLLPAQTLTGDWDSGVTYSVAGGIATFVGHGYIRNITVETL